VPLSEYGFRLRLDIWLCLLPILLRFCPLPELLERHSSVPRPFNRTSSQETELAVRVAAVWSLGVPLALFPAGMPAPTAGSADYGAKTETPKMVCSYPEIAYEPRLEETSSSGR